LIITGTIAWEPWTGRKRKLSTFPGQRGSAVSVTKVVEASIREASHFKIVNGDHLSRIGWMNFPRVDLRGHEERLNFP
jgi:hypothetical protein